MIITFLKIAIRNLTKQKGLTIINILGLSIGLACFTLFTLYAVHEFSFDQFHTDADQIHRIYRWTADMDGEGIEGDPYLPMPLGVSFKDDFPDVKEVVRWRGAWGESFVKVNGKVSRAEVSHVDKNIFDVFSFPIKYGNSNTPLADNKDVVLTKDMAIKLFGEENPTGKTIDIQIEENFETFNISAIAENIPSNSSTQFQIMGSMDYFEGTSYGQRRVNNWNSSFLNVFVKLKEGSGLADNANALLSFRQKYYPDTERELRESGRWKGEGAPVTYKLQPLSKIHTDAGISGGEIPAINPNNIWMLLAIAAGILLIAIINFTTLSIGRSVGRATEVGIRKVVGSSRSQLAGQFILESVLLSIISVVVGLGISIFLLPYFNELSGRDLILSTSEFPELKWLIGGITILTGLLAGSYPAMILSGFRPVEVFKNKIKLGGSNFFTKSLVTTQFALSSGFIIANIVIVIQLNYLYTKNPGFDKENIIVVDAQETDTEQIYSLFKNTLTSDPNILGIASSELGLGAGTGWSRSGFDYKGILKQVYEYYIDDDYINIMGMELLSGRGFLPDRQDGQNRSVIVNESMVKDFGWTNEDAVGQELTGYSDEGIMPKVIGVVKDFHFRSFREEVRPQMFHQFEDYIPFTFFVKIKAGDPSEVLTKLDNTWTSIVPEYPFKYSFLDENLNQFYRAEARFSKIISWAAGLAIFLSCLGLMGLAAMAVVNRNKEIGIRKVLGANVIGIVALISRDFLVLVLLAMLIASPVAYYFMDEWLQDFAFRIDIPWWVFFAALAISVSVAFLTVGYQSIKAAMINPVDSLKNE